MIKLGIPEGWELLMGTRIGLGLSVAGAVLFLLLLISGIAVSADNLIVVTGAGLLVCVVLIVWFVRSLRKT